ncbi:MAG: alpha/beta hydrolase [Burkholderiales bacterium]|nr:alpha/beta hydrolase [Burkholderiales bacterium]
MNSVSVAVKIMARGAAAGLALLLACSAVAGEGTLPAGARVLHDLAYGADPLQRFDVYLPARTAQAPVLFMVHGGAWAFGDKAGRGVVQNKAAHWLALGYAFISVNYRMLPQAQPLEQAADVARALAAAQQQAPSWGADPQRFVLMGHSAGAHLVALLNAAPALAQQQGARPWLGAVSLDSAALDVTKIMQERHVRVYDRAFGTDAAYWQAVSPLHVLTRDAKPWLSICSTQRSDSCPQSVAMERKASSLGLRAAVLEQDLSHADISRRLGEPGPYTDAVTRWIAALP